MSSRRGGGHPLVEAIQPAVMCITGRITPGDVPRLCEELRRLLQEHGGAGGDPPGEVYCDIGGLTQVNLATVDALARLHLVARRRRSRLRLRNAGPELLALLELVGLPELADVA
jgi:ABC-type transporter Mla MlaB component